MTTTKGATMRGRVVSVRWFVLSVLVQLAVTAGLMSARATPPAKKPAPMRDPERVRCQSEFSECVARARRLDKGDKLDKGDMMLLRPAFRSPSPDGGQNP